MQTSEISIDYLLACYYLWNPFRFKINEINQNPSIAFVFLIVYMSAFLHEKQRDLTSHIYGLS